MNDKEKDETKMTQALAFLFNGEAKATIKPIAKRNGKITKQVTLHMTNEACDDVVCIVQRSYSPNEDLMRNELCFVSASGTPTIYTIIERTWNGVNLPIE